MKENEIPERKRIIAEREGDNKMISHVPKEVKAVIEDVKSSWSRD